MHTVEVQSQQIESLTKLVGQLISVESNESAAASAGGSGNTGTSSSGTSVDAVQLLSFPTVKKIIEDTVGPVDKFLVWHMEQGEASYQRHNVSCTAMTRAMINPNNKVNAFSDNMQMFAGKTLQPRPATGAHERLGWEARV